VAARKVEPDGVGRGLDSAAVGLIDATFAAWPERVRGYACRTTAVNILDWQTAYGFPLSPTILAKVEVPTLVLRGEASHPAMKRANQFLAQGMSHASMVTLAGAAHFMISTHPSEVDDRPARGQDGARPPWHQAIRPFPSAESKPCNHPNDRYSRP
jgi:pimeloyl-ACP methyl ester carboxylesterase